MPTTSKRPSGWRARAVGNSTRWIATPLLPKLVSSRPRSSKRTKVSVFFVVALSVVTPPTTTEPSLDAAIPERAEMKIQVGTRTEATPRRPNVGSSLPDGWARKAYSITSSL
jgi:hypothetical protein